MTVFCIKCLQTFCEFEWVVSRRMKTRGRDLNGFFRETKGFGREFELVRTNSSMHKDNSDIHSQIQCHIQNSLSLFSVRSIATSSARKVGRRLHRRLVFGLPRRIQKRFEETVGFGLLFASIHKPSDKCQCNENGNNNVYSQQRVRGRNIRRR